MESWKFNKVDTVDMKKSLLSEGIKSNQVLQNYHDLMMQESEDVWSNYRFFSLRSLDNNLLIIGGLNPQDGLNLYGVTDTSVGKHFINKIMLTENIKQLTALRGNSEYKELSKTINGDINQTISSKSFNCLTKEAVEDFKSSDYRIRVATLDDKEILNKWSTGYNSEMNTNFSQIPNSKVENKRVYLLEDSSSGVIFGGVYNSILRNHNFWIGRLFIFPDYRRQGLGEKFLYLLESYLKNKKLTLHAHTVSTNRKAKELFEKCGYKYIGDGFNASFNIPCTSY